MSNILPFTPQGPRLPNGIHPELKYYELRDETLSVDGNPPRRGDICAVRIGRIVEGEPHMIWTNGGQLICGLLRFEGLNLVMRFPNANFPPYVCQRWQSKIVGHVERFFCAVEGEVTTGLFLGERRPIEYESPAPSIVKRASLEDAALHLIADVPEQAINWRADSKGRILYVSKNWQSYLAPIQKPRARSYIPLVRPSQRQSVALAWQRAIETRTHFDVTCEARLLAGYRWVRNMAVPVRNQETGEDEWVGTLHLLSRELATGS